MTTRPSTAKPTSTSELEQLQLLEEAKKKVETEAFLMKRSYDNGKLMDSLRHASNMIGELRTGSLSASNYYTLYVGVFLNMQQLHSHIIEEAERGENISRLYELVQYAGNIVPRLYLLVTIGSVFIKTKQAPAQKVISDLIEMCKGVQHPIRGLFLRYYLVEMLKDKLPDTGSPYQENDGGTYDECVSFLLQNFTEMNKLWVRTHHFKTPENERLKLKILVASNLSRFSSLEGTTPEHYKSFILPKIVEQIENCRDKVAQSTLMDCIIQVFPDEYHLITLDQLVKTLCKLEKEVEAISIFNLLVKRLSVFVINDETRQLVPEDILHFFLNALQTTSEARSDPPIENLLDFYLNLVNFSFAFHPGDLGKIDLILGDTVKQLKAQQDKGSNISPAATNSIIQLLCLPGERFKDVMKVIQLENFPLLLAFLPFKKQKQVSSSIIRTAAESNTRLHNSQQVEELFRIVGPLFRSKDDQEPEQERDYSLAGSIVHLFASDDFAELTKMYAVAKNNFTKDVEANTGHLRFCIPPLVFGLLNITTTINAEGEEVFRKVFQFIFNTISILIKLGSKGELELSFKLLLQTSLCANSISQGELAFEFVSKAFSLYEDQLVENKDKLLLLIFNVVRLLNKIDEPSFQNLATSAARFANVLHNKLDRCRALYQAAHMFWPEREECKSSKAVLGCLSKCFETATKGVEQEPLVLLELVEQYILFFKKKVDLITSDVVKTLIQDVHQEIEKQQNQDLTDRLNQILTEHNLSG